MVPTAELSSLASTLEELTARISALADGAQSAAQDDVATELFGLERTLTGALRRLRRLADSTRR